MTADAESHHACWLVVVDYETGGEVVRRGPFSDEAKMNAARRTLREQWPGSRYVIWVRVDQDEPRGESPRGAEPPKPGGVS